MQRSIIQKGKEQRCYKRSRATFNEEQANQILILETMRQGVFSSCPAPPMHISLSEL